jgi:hypothetical protein
LAPPKLSFLFWFLTIYIFFLQDFDYLYIMSHVNLRSKFRPGSIKLLAPPLVKDVVVAISKWQNLRERGRRIYILASKPTYKPIWNHMKAFSNPIYNLEIYKNSSSLIWNYISWNTRIYKCVSWKILEIPHRAHTILMFIRWR